MNCATNATCRSCKAGQNLLNGRYCNKTRRYVEYAIQPPCKTGKEADNG